VLYVEDDKNDVLLMRRAWAKVGVANPVQVVIDGEEALRYRAKDSMPTDPITRCPASCYSI
jgi:hypothetical protein